MVSALDRCMELADFAEELQDLVDHDLGLLSCLVQVILVAAVQNNLRIVSVKSSSSRGWNSPNRVESVYHLLEPGHIH